MVQETVAEPAYPAKDPAESFSSEPANEIKAPPSGKGRVAVIDIGSNTVRLVVYDAPQMMPVPMFNEKSQCELARGLVATGKLNPDGVEESIHSMARFISLSDAMGVDHLDLVATAAVRTAEDGRDYVARLKKRFGLSVRVLSGAEEARLSALGVLSGVPEADGLLGDMGGGSLELVALDKGRFGAAETFPLGHLCLSEASGNDPAKARRIIGDHLADLPWLKEVRGRTFYAVGGSWRTIARVFIEQTGYPLHVLDNYTVRRDEALGILHLISGLSLETTEKIPGVPKRRMATLPFAAATLEIILEISQPRELVFSGFGMREGQLLKSLPDELRNLDPLIAGCTSLAEHAGRFSISGDEILEWMSPLFPEETPVERRMRLAACLLSDIGWTEHPDYRAEHAFHRALRVPFAGLTHPDRVLLALAVFIRYNGDPGDELARPLHNLLDEEQLTRVETIGLALRLAHTLSGSAPGLLGGTKLVRKDNALILDLSKRSEVYLGEAVRRRFKTLASRAGLKAKIKT